MKKKRLFCYFLSASLSLTMLAALAACGDADSSGSDSVTETDYANTDITATCKMVFSPSASKTFADNGVEEATITKFTDGDTSTVRTVNSLMTYTIRYLSIDTPESTAGYDKWGKAASVYNKSVLSKATSIVIESEKTTPELDSNGTRYLAYIWYKTADMDTYRNFNLELVENGYSNNNCDPNGKYYEYFQQAEKKAKALKLHIFGKDEDIYYPETINEVTLKDLNTNPSYYYDSETDIPKCVSFDAYISYFDSSSSFRTVTVEQYVDGAYYTYNVDLGYSGPRAYTISTLGAYMHYVGWTTGDGSIHGVVAELGEKSGFYSYRYSQKYYKSLSDAQITKAEYADGKATFTVSADSKTYTLTYADATLNKTTVEAYATSAKHTIKCFIPDNNADDEVTTGFINTLSDIK